MQVQDQQVDLLLNRLAVIRAAIEHNKPQAAIYAVNLMELQLVTLSVSPPYPHGGISRADT